MQFAIIGKIIPRFPNASFFPSFIANDVRDYNKSLLYPSLMPVESVSWMLLSAGAKLEPRSGLGVDGCLL